MALCAEGTGFAQSVTLNSTPSEAVGQPQLFSLSNLANHTNPNLVEGRELYSPIGVALDTTVSPPIIYVSDTGNNRILAWKNSTGFSNGQPADLIIGQTDRYSTSALGPGTAFSATGLSSPTGIAVDGNGNLYVADSGNNRILRFPKPFAQTSQLITPDLVLGQASFSSKTANYAGAVTSTGIQLASSNTIYTAAIALDSSGNVWITDPGNRRVLEFLASDVANGGQGIAAKGVLGQPDFITQQTTLSSTSAQAALTTTQFAIPAGIAFDKAGRLYVSDSDGLTSNSRINRVLVFVPGSGQFSNGQAAKRILGGGCLALAVYSSTTCPALGSMVTSGGETNNANFPFDTLMYLPEGIFLLAPDGSGNQSVGVLDGGFNRILIFPPFTQWPDQATLYSPEATAVIGQPNFTTLAVNGSTVVTGLVTPPATASGLWNPHSAIFLPSANELFIADSQNNRVITMPQSSSGFGAATSVLGQDRLTANSVNLIEGKEFYFSAGNGTLGDAGIALDTTGSTPHLYVADPYNHRVLAFYDIRKISPGQKADLVIGQPDGTTALCNYIGGATTPGGNSNLLTNSSLCSPRDVLVDPLGNLYVADTGNSRVLRFPAPFAQCPNGPGSSGCSLPSLPQADLVLGQSGFNGPTITDPSSTSMDAPYGLAISGNNGLLVSDLGDNRVLYFPFNTTVNSTGTFKPGSNGLAATKVFGQPDFVTTTTGSATNQLNGPHHISTDTSGQLYVADSGNNRVLIFPDPNNSGTPTTSAQANLSLTCAAVNSSGTCTGNLSSPRAVFVNASTGEIWVANSSQSTCVRFPAYNTLIFNNVPTGGVANYGPLALLQDQYGDLFVADSANRVSVYYQGTTWENGASYFSTPLAPGAFALLYPIASSNQFGSTTASFSYSSFPMPATLGGIQVLVNGVAAPLYYVSPSQINFVVPWGTSSSTTANVVVVQQSTGQILGAGSLPMASYAPGIFMGSQITSSAYQAAVVNQDGTVNSQGNPAARGQIISIYATGQGLVSGQPADGALPSGLVTTPQQPQVLIGTCYVDQCQTLPGDQPAGQRVQFSGLSPQYPGLWQINVYVPMTTVPSSSGGAVPLDIVYNNVPAWNASSAYKTYIWVK